MTAATTTTLPPSVETLREQLDDAAKHIGLQRERIKRLEDALKPFADEAATYDCDEDDEEAVLIPGGMLLTIEEGDGTLTKSNIAVADFRKARAVLSGEAK